MDLINTPQRVGSLYTFVDKASGDVPAQLESFISMQYCWRPLLYTTSYLECVLPTIKECNLEQRVDLSCDTSHYPLFSHLLFYTIQNGILYILGYIDYRRYYNAVQDWYLTLRDVNCFEVTRTSPAGWFYRWSYYDIPQVGDDFLASVCEGHYRNLENWSDIGAKVMATDYFFHRNPQEIPLEPERPTQLDRHGFMWACIVASANSRLKEMLLENEKVLLQRRIFSFELQYELADFISTWLGEFISCHRVDRRLAETPHCGAVTSYYNRHFRGLSSPEVLFEASPALCGNLCFDHICRSCSPPCNQSLPMLRGRCYFGYIELPSVATAALQQYLWQTYCNSQTVFRNALRQSLSADFKEVIDDFRPPGTPVPQLETELRLLHSDLAQEIEPLSDDIKYMVADFTRNTIERVHLNWNEISSIFSRPSRLNGLPIEGDAVMETVPVNRAQLLDYAVHNLPPCIQRMLEHCQGVTHLHHPERRRLSAYLRQIGYTKEIAQTIFYLAFSETEVARGEDFYTFTRGKRGSVIENDYRRLDKLPGGTSCMSMVNAGWCPFVDIEESHRAQCTVEMNKQRADEGKPARAYNITSPANYFKYRN